MFYLDFLFNWVGQQTVTPVQLNGQLIFVSDHMERKVRISQNKGKESENSYQKLKRSL